MTDDHKSPGPPPSRAKARRTKAIAKDSPPNRTPSASPPGATDAPIVGVSALLALANWIEERKRSSQEDGP
jgi:hypothetical protein